MVPCLTCGEPCAGPRCPPHQRQHKSKYGPDHRADRARWQPVVDTGTIRCWRPTCRLPITEQGPDGHVVFDLGHRPGQPSHPEHVSCNRAAGAHRTH